MATTRGAGTTEQITEDAIVTATLGHLKGYYKYRDRVGETRIQSRLGSEEGIIADGYLSFLQQNGKKFTATLEATDYMKRKELRFRITWILLLMDALAVSCLLNVLIVGYAYFNKQISFFYLGFLETILLIIGSILLTTVVWAFLFFPNRRYRYIYAIEQFKSYFADDQWVSFAYDVFANYEDKYYKELRRQCIRYGFGLLEVEPGMKMKLHLAPARQDVFGNNRRLVEFAPITKFSENVQQRLRKISFLTRLIKQFRQSKDISNLLRFQRSFYKQILVVLISGTLMGTLIFEELKKSPIDYVDEADYTRQLQQLNQQLEAAPEYQSPFFKIDSGIFVRKNKEYSTPYIVLNPTDPPIPLNPPPAQRKSIVAIYAGGQFSAVDCEDFRIPTRGRYLIYMDRFNSLDEAKRSANSLRKINIAANVVWTECFFDNIAFYLVYYEQFFDQIAQAQVVQQQISGQLRARNLNNQVGIAQMTN